MIEITETLLALALCLAVPLAAGEWARVAEPRIGLLERLGLRWWYGFLLTMIPMVILHAVGVSFTATVAVAAAGIAGGVVAASRHAGLQARSGRAPAAPLVAAGVLIAIGVIHTIAHPVNDWDAVSIWWPKARDLETWRPVAALEHPTYPDLGAMAWGIVSRMSGGIEWIGRVILPIASTMGLLALADTVVRPRGARSYVMVALLMVLLYGGDSFTNGYQDSLLAAAIGVAVVSLVRATAAGGHRRVDEWAGFAVAGALDLIKSEGAPVGCVIVAAYVIATVAREPRASRGERTVGLLQSTLIFAIVASTWPLVLLAHHLDPTILQAGSFSVASLGASPGRLVARLPTILRSLGHVGGSYLRLAAFSAAVSVSGVLVALSWRRIADSTRVALLFLVLVFVMHLALVIVMFLATDAPFEWHLETSLLRLLLDMRYVSGAFAILVVEQLSTARRA